MNAAPPIANAVPGARRSGLLYLRDRVAEYFEAYSVNASVTPVGMKYRSFSLNQQMPSNANRVVFIPGVFDGKPELQPRKYGSLSRSSRNNGSVVNPRELASWERPFTISIWGAPVPGKQFAEDESVGVVEDLLENVVRAVQFAGRASVHWGDVVISAPPVENSFGTELLVSATQIGPLFDVAYDYVQPATILPRGVVT